MTPAVQSVLVQQLRDARPVGWVTESASEYNAESPKQGRKRFNSIVKTINIADLGIIYLCTSHTGGSVQPRAP